ncbi:GNAT family N-acetyltransferase [Frankia sp. QA3]|uniref:GNAT family N-acetyltransferase n=1 Tax=Frankia sp. QA3 TaxID=710111 RepID=UPI000269C172|nr:GNAT family N-acetyltransferase [Frankia sp. QA3]EIV92078.1 lysophospholipase L1-like esterase [Frankia sp. QA3]
MVRELPAGLVVRHPNSDDQQRVLAVMDAWWMGSPGDAGSLRRLLLLPRLFFQHFTASSYLVEHEDGRLAAFLIGFLSQSHPEVAYIHVVGVDPSLRRRGVGAGLYHRFFQLAATRGCSRVQCITSPGNAASTAFHTGIGFQIEPGDLVINGVAVQRDHEGPGLHRVAFTRTLTNQTSPVRPPVIIRDVRVCFLGDSFTAGVGDPTHLGWVGRLAARAENRGLHLTAYNLGIRMDTSAEIRARWKHECLLRLPEASEARLVLSFGVNDMTQDGQGLRVPPDRSVANLTALLAEALPVLPVLMVGPPPSGDPGRDERVAALNEQYAGVCAANDVPYVNVFAALQEQPSWQQGIADGDGAHPAAAGYEQLTNLVFDPWWRWLEDFDAGLSGSVVARWALRATV